MIVKRLLAGVVTVCSLVGLSVPAQAQQFELGDVIVSGYIPTGGTQEFRYKVLCYRPNGQLKTILSDSAGFDFGRLAFSPFGILYATSSRGLETVSPSGQIALVEGLYAFESLAFAADGRLAVGGGRFISRLSPSGAVLNNYRLADDAGVFSLDIAADQCTAYYSGPGVRRFDICRGTTLPDFLPPGGGDFRLLPGGGLAIVRFDGIDIYSSNGAVLRKLATGMTGGGAVALDSDGTSIWVAKTGGALAKFDLATGSLLVGPAQTGLYAINGLTVYGEPRVALANGPLAGLPVLSGWMLLALCAALAVLAMVRLRI